MNNLVLAIGNFDGVHKGHQEIILATKKLALDLNLPNSWGVMFFDPHPRINLKNHKGFLLTSTKEKINLLKKLAVPNIFVVPFNDVKHLTPKEFFYEFLINKYHIKGIVTGEDFNFGKGRIGNSEAILKMSVTEGIKYICLKKHMYNSNLDYSSTNIREFINQGNIKLANNFLGSNFKVSSIVQHGNKLGRTLGFPTANLDIKDYASPKYGVYVVYVYIEGTKYKAIANFGMRPSINNQKKELLEVHLFNFEGDLYSKNIDVEFIDFVREEKNFESLDELKKQMEKDKLFVLDYFTKLY